MKFDQVLGLDEVLIKSYKTGGRLIKSQDRMKFDQVLGLEEQFDQVLGLNGVFDHEN
jgi:hypothetical protein